MYKSRAKTRQRGFTLVEMMVGLALLGVFMSGIFGSVRLSTVLAETTIYDSTSSIVAQGYLEQIKSLPYEDLLLAVQDPANQSLKTLSPTYSSSHQASIMDSPLSIAAGSQPNERTITLDARNNTGTVITMPMRFWVTITDLNVGASPVNALEIKIKYAYKLPNVIGGTWLNGQVQTIRARM
jgi:prepilin-type N-terminal cleavage/methylation domain-containing protein